MKRDDDGIEFSIPLGLAAAIGKVLDDYILVRSRQYGVQDPAANRATVLRHELAALRAREVSCIHCGVHSPPGEPIRSGYAVICRECHQDLVP